jgi:hypothetical protein
MSVHELRSADTSPETWTNLGRCRAQCRIAFRRLFESNFERQYSALGLDRFRPERAVGWRGAVARSSGRASNHNATAYLVAQSFGVRRYCTQSTVVYEDLPVNLFAVRHFLVSNVARWPGARTCRLGSATRRSSALQQQQMLASAEIEDFAEPVAALDPRDARLTVRLVPEDRALLRERAAARKCRSAVQLATIRNLRIIHTVMQALFVELPAFEALKERIKDELKARRKT